LVDWPIGQLVNLQSIVVSHPVSGRDVKSAYEIKRINFSHKQREQEAILKEEIKIN
jgi:hypothetical protein